MSGYQIFCMLVVCSKFLLCPILLFIRSLKVPMKEKNNSCLFERLFKVKKNGVFLFGISFFVLEIFTFLYYALKQDNTQSRISLEILKQ